MCVYLVKHSVENNAHMLLVSLGSPDHIQVVAFKLKQYVHVSAYIMKRQLSLICKQQLGSLTMYMYMYIVIATSFQLKIGAAICNDASN